MICMICDNCKGRWVALMIGSTHQGGRSSYHFASDSLNCPRCGTVGTVNGDVVMAYQDHPDAVASTSFSAAVYS